MADTFTYFPDFNCKATYVGNVHVTKFNDGYEQRTPYGINTQAENWDLVFSNRTFDEALAIKAFLKRQGGVNAFSWTTPDGDTLLFVCRPGNYAVETVKYNLKTITAKFEQVFES